MIRIYSADYDKKDYRLLKFALEEGMAEVKKTLVSCTGHCDSCYCGRVCRSLYSAISYVDKKAEEYNPYSKS